MADNLRLGMQMAPWSSARAMVDVGQRMGDAVDVVWVQDQMLARNVYVMVAALAQAGCGVGTNVTYPTGRNPIEMASAAATASELLADGRELMIGFGTGGALVSSLFKRDRPITTAREAITLMRRLWAGEELELDAFPALGAACGYKPGAVAKLTYPVPAPPAIVVAGVGPRILEVAAEVADGLICPSNMPSLCHAAFMTGRFGEISRLTAVHATRPVDAAPLRLIYGINVSVSEDRERARAMARRQTALIAGNVSLWRDLETVGLDMGSAEEVKAAFEAGRGVSGAAERVSASLADALIVSGTPDECIERMAELRRLAEDHGFGEFYIGAPLGPDPIAAADLLRDRVIVEVWPERVAHAL